MDTIEVTDLATNKPKRLTLHVVGGLTGVALFGSFLYSILSNSSVSGTSPRSSAGSHSMQQQVSAVYKQLYLLEKSTYQLNAQIAKMNQQLTVGASSHVNFTVPTPNITMPPATQTVTSASGVVY